MEKDKQRIYLHSNRYVFDVRSSVDGFEEIVENTMANTPMFKCRTWILIFKF